MFLTLYRQPCETKSRGNGRESTEPDFRRQTNMNSIQTSATNTIEERLSLLYYSVNSLVNLNITQSDIKGSVDHVRIDTEAKRLSIHLSIPISTTSSGDTLKLSNEIVTTQDETRRLIDSSETSTFNYDDLFKSGSLPVHNAYNSNRTTNEASGRQCPANDQSDDNRTYDVIPDESLDETNTSLSEASINNDTTSEYVVGRIA